MSNGPPLPLDSKTAFDHTTKKIPKKKIGADTMIRMKSPGIIEMLKTTYSVEDKYPIIMGMLTKTHIPKAYPTKCLNKLYCFDIQVA